MEILASTPSNEHELLQTISQAVHDQIGGHLTITRIHLRSLRDLLANAPPAVAKALDQLEQDLDTIHRSARKVEELIVPSAILEGLDGALESLCDLFKDVPTQIGVDCPPQEAIGVIPRDVASDLYYVAKEALSNAVKASATFVYIQVKKDQGSIVLSIHDDGPGIPEHLLSGSSEGRGLRGIRWRAQRIGAELSIQSKGREGGASIVLTLQQRLAGCQVAPAQS